MSARMSDSLYTTHPYDELGGITVSWSVDGLIVVAQMNRSTSYLVRRNDAVSSRQS